MLENRSKRGERREESTDKSSRMHENAQMGKSRIGNRSFDEISIERKIEIRKEISDRFVK